MRRISLIACFALAVATLPQTAPAQSAPPPSQQSSRATSSTTPTPACAVFLKTSERAAQQWELERRYRIFESNLR